VGGGSEGLDGRKLTIGFPADFPADLTALGKAISDIAVSRPNRAITGDDCRSACGLSLRHAGRVGDVAHEAVAISARCDFGDEIAGDMHLLGCGARAAQSL
jgi:hypothetical protein